MTDDLPSRDHLPSGNPGDESRLDEPPSNPIPPSTSRSDPNITDGAPIVRYQDHQRQRQKSSPSQPQKSIDASTDSTYHLKWISWNSVMIPIVMQSINGPCPLIATMNVLLLREKIKLPNMLEQITENQLLAYIGESIMDSVPADAKEDENILLNMEQNINDAIEILPKLKTGLDVNIRFTGITDFEYTPECIIFDLLRIPLYHGWLSDPNLIELRTAIGDQSYNQLVDSIITHKASQDPVVATRILIAEEFLDKTASQLTQYGLNELRSRIKDNEIGILFRNNHFLTLFKREGEIYTLVTDHGYLTEDNIVWETLDNIEGAGRFFDANFQLSEMTNRQMSEMKAIDERQQQMDNDYLIALSMKEEETKQVQGAHSTSSQRELDDLEVAKKLQEEEDRYYAKMIDKKKDAAISHKPDRQMDVWLEENLFSHSQEHSAGTTIQPEFRTSSKSSRDLIENTDQNRPTYAQAAGTRSIWGRDGRTAAEQADSWNEGLKRSVPTGSYTEQAASESSQADSSHCVESNPIHQADSLQPANTSSRASPPVPQVTQEISQVAAPSQNLSRIQSASSANRRSRSEKPNKESNCVMQ